MRDRTKLVKKVHRLAKQAGLFLLLHWNGVWEFISLSSNNTVLTWQETSGAWKSPLRAGITHSALQVVQIAINVEARSQFHDARDL